MRIRQRNSKRNLEKDYNNWKAKGMPLPPPHVVKQNVVKEYKEKFGLKTLVETGTFLGDMVFSQKENFDKLISIELDNKLYKDARNKLKKYKKIEIIQGDSGKILDRICSNLNEPCLFWLDGHFSAGYTAKGESGTPIIAEIKAILRDDLNHIILIDDARCFTGQNDYPTLDFLKDFLFNRRKAYKMDVVDDIIRFYPDSE